MTLLRLILTPDRPGNFAAHLGDDLICISRQPFLDGARELLRRGYDPALLLTTRHVGKAYDNFVPAPLGERAKWTVTEGSQAGLRLECYHPFAVRRSHARWP